MRIIAAIVISALVIGLSSPLCLNAIYTPDHKKNFIGMLDVCHHLQSGVSADSDTPVILCASPDPAFITFSEEFQTAEATHIPKLPAFQKSRPPKA